jgi:UDP-N-acetylglucosamine--N-acetylmuramyl-(pentapeptide) pyrophosphoryl-undecaprenol N-acetylglucosamine transferase
MSATILIMAGGTGGHVFPGLAVARVLRAQQHRVVWLGTRRGLEARAVPAADLGIDLEWLSIRGVRRAGLARWLLLPFALARSLWQSFRVLRRHQPDVVLSMGGFVAGPGGVMAWLTGTPLVIHEQNAIPGVTNRLLARLADRVLCGFPQSFAARVRTLHVGNPVRHDIAALAAPATRLAGRGAALRLLVVGGSQGARVFNEIVPAARARLRGQVALEVWHQCGRDAQGATAQAYADDTVKVAEFIDDMAQAYGWADVVLCRAGAMTVAEVAAAGVASILVPYPYAVDDHQTANARYLVERGAAMLLPQAQLTAERLAEVLSELANNRAVLLKMAQAARAAAIVDATDVVARECLEAVHA